MAQTGFEERKLRQGGFIQVYGYSCLSQMKEFSLQFTLLAIELASPILSSI